jgi:hypothetical protein
LHSTHPNNQDGLATLSCILSQQIANAIDVCIVTRAARGIGNQSQGCSQGSGCSVCRDAYIGFDIRCAYDDEAEVEGAKDLLCYIINLKVRQAICRQWGVTNWGNAALRSFHADRS